MTEQHPTDTATTGPAADEPAQDAQSTPVTPPGGHTGAEDTAAVQEQSSRPEQSPEDLAKASDVEEYMRDVIDPELGINVVDLGLVYDIWIEDATHAVIEMTLTSPACPLTDMLEEQAEAAVVGSGCCTSMDLRWVWMPPWGPHMITEDGREQLRALGFSV